MLAKDYRKAKKRRGSSGEDVKDEGRVLHHLCCADDLYAMAGTTNHLTRILEDKTNAIERLGMRWKEKSLTIVAGPFTECKPGDTVEITIYSGCGLCGILESSWWQTPPQYHLREIYNCNDCNFTRR